MWSLVIGLTLTLPAPAPAPAVTVPPPDPRLGERLDGRAPPAIEGRNAPNLVAAPVRGAAWLVLAPVDRTVGFFERHRVFARVYEALTSDDRLVGMRPLVNLQPGYGFAVGARYFDRRTLGPGSLVGASLRASLRALETTFTLEPPGISGLGFHLGFARRDDAIFGGTEGETRDELRAQGLDVVRYRTSRAAAALTLSRRLRGPFRLDLTGSIDRRLYGNGVDVGDTPPIESLYCTPTAAEPCFVDPRLVPGYESGVRLMRAEGTLVADTRPDPRFGGGLVARLGAAYAQGFAGDPSRHGVLSAGAGGVIPLGDRALSVHVRGGMVEALGDAPVPFDELLSPSGAGGLRGLPRGRLRGPSELVASLEYRWLLTLWMDAMLFVDRGNAYGPRFSGLTPGRAFTTGGLALMVIGNEAADYRRNNPLFGVQLAVTADDGLNYSLAFVVH